MIIPTIVGLDAKEKYETRKFYEESIVVAAEKR
jgi:hypothetical protein